MTKKKERRKIKKMNKGLKVKKKKKMKKMKVKILNHQKKMMKVIMMTVMMKIIFQRKTLNMRKLLMVEDLKKCFQPENQIVF